MAEATGISAVLDAIDVTADLPIGEVEQLDLLGLPVGRSKTGEAVVSRGPGRPPGARNRRTEQMAGYLLARYTHPLETLAQIQAASVAELAATLGCSALEALQEKRLAAIAVLPYVAQRMPQAIDLTNRNVVHLTINDGVAPAAASASAPDMTLVGHVVKIMENQGDNDGSPDAV